AQAQAYGTIGGGFYFGDAGIDMPVANARLGVNIGQNFGVEAEAMTGLDDDTGTGGSLEIDHLLAAYGRVRGQVAPNVELFARLGYYTMEASGTLGALTVSADDDDFTAGVGAEFGLGGRTGLRLDYTNYAFDGDLHS